MAEGVDFIEVVTELKACNLLPAIIFRSARAQCDADVERASRSRRIHLSVNEQHGLRVKVHEVVKKYDLESDLVLTHPQYASLILTGVGAHHAGQLLSWRLLLEELMSAGLMKALVATGTVAAGVDFPARTVVITAHSRRGANGYQNFSSSEFQQMSGRAGRRGKDTVGFCLVAPSMYCDPTEVAHIAQREPEPLKSAYFPGPSTVLNLLRYRNVDDLRYTIQRSLASFTDAKEAKRARELAKEEIRILAEPLRSKLLQTIPGEGQEFPDLGDVSEGKGVSKEDRKNIKRVKRLYREADLLLVKQRGLLEQSLSGLGELGYLEGTALSEKGNWASNLCTSLVLELGEVIGSGMLDGISLDKLVAIVAALCADEHRQYLVTKTPPISVEEVEKLKTLIGAVRSKGMPGVSSTISVVPNASHTVLIWMNSENWQYFRGILQLVGVAEGDAARVITQTADQLGQIARLDESHPQLAKIAEEGKRRLLRPPLTEGIGLTKI